jgi:hypothetical protein
MHTRTSRQWWMRQTPRALRARSYGWHHSSASRAERLAGHPLAGVPPSSSVPARTTAGVRPPSQRRFGHHKRPQRRERPRCVGRAERDWCGGRRGCAARLGLQRTGSCARDVRTIWPPPSPIEASTSIIAPGPSRCLPDPAREPARECAGVFFFSARWPCARSRRWASAARRSPPRA